MLAINQRYLNEATHASFINIKLVGRKREYLNKDALKRIFFYKTLFFTF
jgi:hypothetical protein